MRQKRHTQELEYCTYCPKLCRHSCPVSNATGSETVIPQTKMELFCMLQRGTIDWNVDYAKPLYACTACRLCQQYCLHNNDVATVLLEGRAMAEEMGVGHPFFERFPEKFRSQNENLRAKLQRELPPESMASEARYGYLPGTDAVESSFEDILDALEVFESLELPFVKVIDAPLVSSGYELWASGHRDAAHLAAKDMVRRISRFATVITGSAACTYYLREFLPKNKFAHNTEIFHISEFLGIHADRLNIQRRRKAAYFHDPCYLGRYLGVYDPPRRLLARCVNSPREFFHSREQSECCGAGTLLSHYLPEVADK
ncbi:MAG: (Fe-S)-binding protein, partial [Pseudomonadota bacterium]